MILPLSLTFYSYAFLESTHHHLYKQKTPLLGGA